MYVLDFGIAKLLAGDGGAPAPGTLTDRGAWLGTPAYMAPEQWGADGAGPASDRYALGAIAFEMLEGKRPFQASSLPAMMERHFRAPVPTTTMGSAVDRVLARAMAKDPEDRYPSATAMVEDLRAALGTSRGARAAVAAPRGRVPIGAIVLGGAVVAGAAVTAVLLAGGDSRKAAAPARPEPEPAGPSVEVSSTPSGARVRVDGVDRGATPVSLPAADLAGADVVIEKPGYLADARHLGADAADLRVQLAPVTRFEGVWALPDGALRAFERQNDRVAMFTLAAARGERVFKGFFDFVAGDPGKVAFVASEDHIDPRGPDEPSCRVPLRAQYVYDPAADTLARRQERAQIDWNGTRCLVTATEWGETLVLARAGGDGEWAESNAGAGVPTREKAVQNPKKKRPTKAPDEPQQTMKPPSKEKL